MSVSVKDIAWLAGLLEGEGSFFTLRNGYSPRVAIAMTDRDVIERSAALVGAKPYLVKRKRAPEHHKAQYWWVLNGWSAAGVMMTIYPLMGERRKAKLREVLAQWKAKPTRQKPHGLGVISNCRHFGRTHYAHGMCHACYEGARQRRAR